MVRESKPSEWALLEEGDSNASSILLLLLLLLPKPYRDKRLLGNKALRGEEEGTKRKEMKWVGVET